MRRLPALLAAGVFACAGPASAQPQGAVVRVTGWVPAICRAEVVSLERQGARLTGELHELCNTGGYEIWMEPAAGARPIRVGGEAAQTDAYGRVLIARAPQAGVRRRVLDLDFGQAAPPSAVAFSVSPIR